MIWSQLLSIGFAGLFTLILSSQLFAQEDAVAKRKAYMRENYDAWKAVKKAAEEKDYATIQLKAKDIMEHMDHLLEYFPKGSITEKSRAKPEIWTHWDEFSKIPVKVKDMANDLAQAAAAKDDAKVQALSKTFIGPEGSPYRGGACFQCHKDYFNDAPAVKK